jgi:hypothetical protein
MDPASKPVVEVLMKRSGMPYYSRNDVAIRFPKSIPGVMVDV